MEAEPAMADRRIPRHVEHLPAKQHPGATAFGGHHLDRQGSPPADETGNHWRGRPSVEFLRRSELLQPTPVHHGHMGCHRHGFVLVMGDEDEGGTRQAVNAPELGEHRLA